MTFTPGRLVLLSLFLLLLTYFALLSSIVLTAMREASAVEVLDEFYDVDGSYEDLDRMESLISAPLRVVSSMELRRRTRVMIEDLTETFPSMEAQLALDEVAAFNRLEDLWLRVKTPEKAEQAIASLPRLRSLALYHTEAFDFTCLQGLPLTSLWLNGFDRLSPEQLAVVAALPWLETLHIDLYEVSLFFSWGKNHGWPIGSLDQPRFAHLDRCTS